MNSKKASNVRKEELARIFRMAIRAEQRAQKMYQHALVQCDDDDTRRILIGLCEDEERHEKEIAGLYTELQQFFAIRDRMENTPHPGKSVRAVKKEGSP